MKSSTANLRDQPLERPARIDQSRGQSAYPNAKRCDTVAYIQVQGALTSAPKPLIFVSRLGEMLCASCRALGTCPRRFFLYQADYGILLPRRIWNTPGCCGNLAFRSAGPRDTRRRLAHQGPACEHHQGAIRT